MQFNPNNSLPITTPNEQINCTICLDEIVADNQATCEEEKSRTLDCSHIFHRECIGSWLVQKE